MVVIFLGLNVINTVECRYNVVWFITILHTVTTATDRKSGFKLTTDTPYLGLTGEIWDVQCENFEENWLRYYGTTLWYAEHYFAALGAKYEQLI